MSFRDYVQANLFDGSDEGRVTMTTATLLDELQTMFDEYLIAVVRATVDECDL